MQPEQKFAGINQLIENLMERYEIAPYQAFELLDRCLFDHDVIVAVLDIAEELMEEKK